MSTSRIWELFALKFNKEISDEELQELRLLLEEHPDLSEVTQTLSLIKKLTLEDITSEQEQQKSLESIREMLAKQKNETKQTERESYFIGKRKQLGWITGIAATIIGLIAIVWFFSSEKNSSEGMRELATANGSKRTIQLPDGSSVILNAESKLRYNKDFGVKHREIELEGEAYFDIVKNEKLPLTVHAGSVDIKVKGTVFNVKAYNEDSTIEASLITGAIEVIPQNNPERKILLKPKEKIRINKNTTNALSKVVADENQPTKELIKLDKINVNAVDSSIYEIAWIQQKLNFTREPFQTLAKKMESWYNVSIHFNNQNLANLTFTGSFEKETLVEALEALREITKFDYTIENKNVFIGKK